LTVSRLDSGDAAVVLRTADGSLKGSLASVDTPQSCLPIHNRNSLERIPGYLNDLGEKVPDRILQKCYYEGAFYDNGEQWQSSHVQCQMCSCQRGSVVCDEMVCPTTICSDPIIPAGECCATCSPSTAADSGRGCTLGEHNRFHPEGSRWHPYIPPFGFSRCAVCTCQVDILSVACHKEECPALDCPLEDQTRPGPLHCCKVCKTSDEEVKDLVAIDPPDQQQQHDMAVARTGQDILASGGCKLKGIYHENGDNWHPTVLPWGQMKCINCTCKDGNTNCRKLECPKLRCPLVYREEDRCCPRCAANRHEQIAARRQIHQSNLRHMRRLRRLRHRTAGGGN